MSNGTSKNTGPVLGESALARAATVARYASSADWSVVACLVIVRTRGGWSSSCNEPIPQRASGARPPTSSSGLSLEWAAATAEIAFVTPGPAVTVATPHWRVTFDQPSAAKVAVCSWRVSMIRMPCSTAPVSIGQMWAPLRVKRWLVPASLRARTISSPVFPDSGTA